MKKIGLSILAVVLLLGCGAGEEPTATPSPAETAPASTQAPAPATPTAAPPTAAPTSAPPTNTAVPTPTRPPSAVPPTVTPTPAAASYEAISAETAARLVQVAGFELRESFVNTLVFSPDSRTLISGDRNGEVLLWERDTWEKTVFLPARSTRAADSAAQVWFWGTLALSPDGRVIATAYGDDGAVTGRDRAGQELFAFSYGTRVYGVSFSPDGQLLAVGGMSNNVVVFDLESKQPLVDLADDHEYVMNVAFSADGQTLLASYERPQNVIKTWDTATWQATASFTHTVERTDYHDVLFSPDSKELVIATVEDVEIRFLDRATGQVVQELPEHSRAPYQLAFSPDGSLLASAGDDGTVRLWNMETGDSIKTIRCGGEAGAVAFSPDGTLIAFSVWGEGLQVWAVGP